MPHFTANLKDHGTPLIRSWNECLGAGHAPLSLRADWQTQLRRCKRELGLRHVRFHGILSDAMGTCVMHENELLFSFHNIDAAYDALIAMGVRPVVELSFMPSPMASGHKTVMHYAAHVSPPKDWKDWEKLIRQLARHWVDRYGIEEVSRWPIEVWNEPNLKAFYTSRMTDYVELYEHTARALKEVDSRLQVGGPATAKNEWLAEFVSVCEDRGLPLDFLSTHIYPTDALGNEADDTVTQLSKSTRDVLRDKAQIAFEAARGRPVWYTEWSSSSNPRDPLHDRSYAAAYATKAILDNNGLVKAYSWWTFSDIFEENYFPSSVFQGGFGLLTVYNTPKPIYSAYRLMNGLGNELLPVDGEHVTVGRWVSRSPRSVAVMLTNMALPKHDIETQTVTVTLHECPDPAGVHIQRIDADCCNPERLWQQLGSPRYLNEYQIDLLEDAGRPETRVLEHTYHPESRTLTVKIELPAQALALFTVTLSAEISARESSVPAGESSHA